MSALIEYSSTATTHFSLAPGTTENLTLAQQRELLSFYAIHSPALYFIPRTHAGAPPPDSIYISNAATIHDYVIYQGRRITPSAFDGNAGSSIIQYDFGGRRFVGEVATILTHIQPIPDGSVMRQHLLAVKWFVQDKDYDTSIWDTL